MVKVFKDYNSQEISKLEKASFKILSLEKHFNILTNKELSNKTFEFKKRLSNGESLDDILFEAFAVCREASFRILGKKHFKVQLMGGIALHQGRIIEMKTGEGKTLTEVCPAYLNSLLGEGVHIVTANEYLAERDRNEMGKIFEFLNISVGLVKKNTIDKKNQYSKDIIYTTNEELGFDYLRDNLIYNLNDKVQRKLNYVIIDEVDSILIDDSKTPLIISEKDTTEIDIYYKIDSIVKRLTDTDFYIDKKENSIFLSNLGMIKVEQKLSLNNLTLPENSKLNHIVHQSLIANYLLSLDKDYVVKENELFLIDSNTGRIAEGRVFSNGLQQCLEAKENLHIKSGTNTIATITYQNFFRLYKKISGMSGTVKTEESEFREIYNLDVIVIPTNKKVIRVDNVDRVFLDEFSKLNAILKDVITTNKKGQPILIGTQTIKESEELANLFKKNNLKFKLLNAKNLEDEASIIKTAGEKNSIIIATNIAGRGTDIILSDESLKLGGLKVIGCSRSESLRIDNQLIGRAGRQGEPGESQIYVSCDDILLHTYGQENLKDKLIKKGFNKGEMQYKVLKKYINSAQKYINTINFDIRKNTLQYDEVIGIQREIIYKERNLILTSNNLGELISKILTDYIENIFLIHYKHIINLKHNKNKIYFIKIKEIPFNKFKTTIFSTIYEKLGYRFNDNVEINITYIWEYLQYVVNILIDYFNNRFINNPNIDEIFIRSLFLNIIDKQWKNYLKVMDYLKLCVINESYNQKDPIQIYKIKANDTFNELTQKINTNLIESLYMNII